MENPIDKSDNKFLIEIKIKRINQLFNSLDPSPFLEKDLDDDAFEYIYSSVAEHPHKKPMKIRIHMPQHQKKKISESEIRKAMKNFFEYKSLLSERNIKNKIQEGQLSLVVGVGFLAICLFTANWIVGTYDNLVANIASEGLLIGGWVAMWRPISIMLYDWWPLRKEKRMFEKIAGMNVEVKYT
jgi:hypothetical protein